MHRRTVGDVCVKPNRKFVVFFNKQNPEQIKKLTENVCKLATMLVAD